MSDERIDPPEKTYLGQKKQVIALLSECIERGNVYLDDASQSDANREEVEHGLSILREAIIGFYEFLERGFEEGIISNPSFINIAQFFRAALGGSSMAFRHLDMSELTLPLIHEEIAKVARAAKVPMDERRMAEHREVLREFIGYRQVTMPYKEADAIFNTPSEISRLEALCEERGIDMFSRSTAIRRFKEMTVPA